MVFKFQEGGSPEGSQSAEEMFQFREFLRQIAKEEKDGTLAVAIEYDDQIDAECVIALGRFENLKEQLENINGEAKKLLEQLQKLKDDIIEIRKKCKGLTGKEEFFAWLLNKLTPFIFRLSYKDRA